MHVPALLRQSLLLVAVFAVVTAIASAAGAVNLGTAMTFGQVAFAATLVLLVLRSPRQPDAPDQESSASAPSE
jgi:hypothetical protein